MEFPPVLPGETRDQYFARVRSGGATPTSGASNEASISAYEPSRREKITGLLAQMLDPVISDNYRQQRTAETLTGLLDFLPGLGAAGAQVDAADAADRGDYGMSTLYAGAAGLDAVPGVGPPIRKGVTKGLKAAEKAAAKKAAAEKAAARKTARAEQGSSRARDRTGTTGQYVGAPRGVDTPRALQRARKKYMDAMETGAAGRDWYKDSSQFISDTTDPSLRQGAADVLGITSAGTGVDPNMGFAVKALNQSGVGAPVNTGRFPDSASPLSTRALAGDRSKLGPKRQPFADNLSVNWNPEMAQHPVHDIWDGRAWGYTNAKGKPWDAGFSSQQHSFMDDQMDVVLGRANDQSMGGFDDWDGLSGQAAAWTGAQIKAKKLKPEDAAKHYGSYSPKYQANATFEQTPGAGVGHLEELLGVPYAERQAFADAAPWTDARGRDRLYSDARQFVEPSVPAQGIYTPAGTGITEFNPMEVARPLVQTDDTGALIPEARSLLETVEGSRAYIDAQNAGAANNLTPAGQAAAGDETSILIDMATDNPDAVRRLNEFAGENGFFMIDSGDGVRLVKDEYNPAYASNFITKGDPTGGKNLGAQLSPKKPFRKQLDELTGGAPVQRARVDTTYSDYEGLWGEGLGSGAATTKFLDDLDATPVLRDNIEGALRDKARANMQRDAKVAETNGWEMRTDIQNARKILAENGLAGLRKALKSGAVLPAVAAAILAPSVLRDPQEAQTNEGL